MKAINQPIAAEELVIGAVNGRFREVFEKIAPLHAKNAFTLAIVIGDLFANPSSTSSEEDDAAVKDLVEGQIKIPIPTYFMLGRHTLPLGIVQKLEQTDGEVCENLTYLGKRTTFKTSEGMRIVALGGTLDAGLSVASSKDKYIPFYNAGDAKALKGANTADLLLTTDWPEHIERGSQSATEGIKASKPAANAVVADLCATLKPRYHFSASSSTFFEREPFFHQPTDGDGTAQSGHLLTRFLSLAPFGNLDKQKWIYAFTVDLQAPPNMTIPAGATASPLTDSSSRKRPAPQDDGASGFSRFARDDGSGHRHRRTDKRQRAPPPGPADCFFCLSNPNLATHLVTSIGTDAYLTTAKGPLSTRDTFPTLDFPCHILIIPLPHTATFASIPDDETRRNTVQEMHRYRKSLNKMISQDSAQSLGHNSSANKDTSATNALGSVTWEVSRSAGIHTHWQYLPVSANLVSGGLVEAAFKVEAENEKYPAFNVITKIGSFSNSSPSNTDTGESQGRNEEDEEHAQGDFFEVRIWRPSSQKGADGEEEEGGGGGGEEAETVMRLPLTPSFRFNLQFGRRVLAKLLGLDSRFQWRECNQTEAEETADAEAFKVRFEKFDFTLTS